MQPSTVRSAPLSSLILLLILAFARPAAADPSGEYQGWLWETGVFLGSGAFSEEYCFSRNDLAFAVDLNWTLTTIDDVCWGRTTTNTGRTQDNYPPFTAFNGDPDQSTRPLINAGGNLWELWGQEFEQGVGLGEERLAAIMSSPSNDNLLIAGGYYEEADQFNEEYFRFVDLFVKNTAATQNARVAADLENTQWRIPYYFQELLATGNPSDVNVEVALAGIDTLTLGTNGSCSYSVSSVFPDFVDNGDAYRAFQFDFGVNFDDRFVRGGHDERDYSACTWSIDADKYLAVTQTLTRALDPNNPITFTTRAVVSDDNSHLVLAPGTTLEDSGRALLLGYRVANQLASNAIDKTYFYYLTLSEFGSDGAGAIAAGFGPRDWQEFELMGRGKLVFDSTTVSSTPTGETGTWYSCDMDVTLGEIEYEFTGSTSMSDVALNNFTADSGKVIFEECDFRLDADGGLSVHLFLADGENPGDDFEIIMRGYVNENGEIVSLVANAIDEDPLNPGNIDEDVASLYFVLGMEYTGNPDGDADGDGFTNDDEFRIPLPGLDIVEQDTDGDGNSDVLFRNNVTGANQLYLMSGKTISQNLPVSSVSADWEAVGRGDYDGNGTADILWRYTPTGALWIYFMQGTTITASEFVATISDTNWKIVGNGDYNGDGKSDILLRLTTTGTVWLYEMDGSTILNGSGVGVVPDSNWKIVGSGDYNGDGRSDILWRNIFNGANWMYLMNGPNITADTGISVTADLNWEVVGNGDYNGDGKSDVLWRNSSSGTNWLYLMDGFTIDQSASISVLPDPNWKIVGDGDYNGDGFADVLWRNMSTGSNYMYIMNGFNIIDFGTISVVTDQNWQIVNTP